MNIWTADALEYSVGFVFVKALINCDFTLWDRGNLISFCFGVATSLLDLVEHLLDLGSNVEVSLIFVALLHRHEPLRSHFDTRTHNVLRHLKLILLLARIQIREMESTAFNVRITIKLRDFNLLRNPSIITLLPILVFLGVLFAGLAQQMKQYTECLRIQCVNIFLLSSLLQYLLLVYCERALNL